MTMLMYVCLYLVPGYILYTVCRHVNLVRNLYFLVDFLESFLLAEPL